MILPTLTFTIPSIQDYTEIECRIYRSSNPSPPGGTVRGVVLAHPYANLGGCFDDPAVLAATQVFFEAGYVVGTFNFRGAGGSKGSTSWTGLPELADYVSFVGFFVHFLKILCTQTTTTTTTATTAPLHLPSRAFSSSTESSATQVPSDNAPPSPQPPPCISLILGGYSYGSRILTYLPSISSIVRRFSTSGKPGSAEAVISETAASLAEKELANDSSVAAAAAAAAAATATAAAGSYRNGGTGGGEASPKQRHRHHSVHVGGSDEPSSPRAAVGVAAAATIAKGHRQQQQRSRHSSLGSPKRLSASFKKGIEAVKEKRRSIGGAESVSNKTNNDEGSNDDDHHPPTPQSQGQQQQQQQQLLQRNLEEEKEEPHISIDLRHLLISPVLPPVGWLTSPRLDRPAPRPPGDPSPSRMQVAGQSMDVVDEWWHYPSLVLFGNDDQFTSAKKVHQWLDGLSSGDGSASKIKADEIDHQGHFWHSLQSEERLKQALMAWAIQTAVGIAAL